MQLEQPGRGRVAGISFQPPPSRFGGGGCPLGVRGARLVGGLVVAEVR